MINDYKFHESAMDWTMVASSRNRFYLKYWCELGAGYSDQTALALDVFEKCYSVEIVPEVFDNQVEAARCNERSIRFCGDTLKCLPTILKELDAPTYFRIDSHWPGAGPKIGPECPLLDELKIIAEWSGARTSVVSIDNAGMFINPPKPPCDPKQWPNMDEVIAILRKTWNAVTLVGDVLYATPEPLIQRLA